MLDVKATLSEAEERMEMAAMYLDEQLQRIRAGRANAAILDGVRVNSYGSMVPLNQVASVTIPDHAPSPSAHGTRKPSATLKRPSWTPMSHHAREQRRGGSPQPAAAYGRTPQRPCKAVQQDWRTHEGGDTQCA